MRVLLVDLPEPLGEPVAAALGQRHQVRTLTTGVRDPEAVAAAADVDVVVQGPGRDHLIERATLGTWNLMTGTRAHRYIRLSTMRLLDAYDERWWVTEDWQPQPTAVETDLAAYLGELASRELARTGPTAWVLRLDEVGSDSGPTSLSTERAVAAVVDAVQADDDGGPAWRVWHVVEGTGRYQVARAARPPLSLSVPEPHGLGKPAGDPVWPARPEELGPLQRPQRVTILGAGGPLGVAAYEALRHEFDVMLTDRDDASTVAARPPQLPGAPRFQPVTERWQQVDVVEPDQLNEAALGSDCLVACSVVRDDPVAAFSVNVMGAVNTMRAAVAAGVPRVVQTGPALVLPPHPVGYLEDRDVTEVAPPRAGANLYFLTKLLGLEASRIMAEHAAIACPTLLLCALVDPTLARTAPLHPWAVSWRDAGRAIAAAVAVPTLPEPGPRLHIGASSPHGRYSFDAAREVLGWSAADSLTHLWHTNRRSST